MEALGAGERRRRDAAGGGGRLAEAQSGFLAARGAADDGVVEVEREAVVLAEAHDVVVARGGGHADQAAGEGGQAGEERGAALAVVDQHADQAGRAGEVDRGVVGAVGLAPGHRPALRFASAARKRASRSASSSGL
jgi:hypothetical protein